jgi:hypothetical protein
MTHSIDFVTKLPNGEFVNSCWRNSVNKMVNKSAAVRTRRKAVRTPEEFYFFRESRLQSRLQARPDELDKQEFPRASSTVLSELRPNTYVFFRLMTFTKKVSDWKKLCSIRKLTQRSTKSCFMKFS